MKHSRLAIASVLLFMLVAGIWWSTKPKGDEDGGRRGRGPASVKVESVQTRPMPIRLEATGRVEPEQSVQVRSQVNGVLDKVLFEEGSFVRQGQVLFQIDPRTFEAAMQQAKAALARDEAQWQEARSREARLAPLVEREYITRQEYEQALASAKALEATVQANRAVLQQAQLQLERSRIEAPIAGRTGNLAVKAGNLVTANAGEPLVVINRIQPVLINFTVPQRQLADINRYRRQGPLPVEVTQEGGGQVIARGNLVFIDNAVDADTGTMRLKARVPNDKEALWPGQFVGVRLILTTEPQARVLPERAVHVGQQGHFVYIVEQGTAKMRPVTLARTVDGLAVIADGLSGEEQVIVEAPSNLAPDMPVRVSAAAPASDNSRP